MSAASLRSRYLGNSIATASPQQLLVMLYERLALDLERGEVAMAAGDRQQASEQLQHAQEIILELQASLRIDIWDGGPRLNALYAWLLSELIRANTKGDLRRVGDCRRIVEPLRAAGRAAAASLASSPA